MNYGFIIISGMMKIFLDNNGRFGLDKRLVEACSFINFVDSPTKADVIFSRSTATNLKLVNKTIYICAEAPRTSHRKWCYSHFDDFKLVVCHNPESGKNNQIPFTPDDSPQYFPSQATVKPEERKDTTIKSRGVFFAGHRRENDITPDTHGGYNLIPLRKSVGNYLIKEFPSSKFIGIGWFGQTTKVQGWGNDKGEQINNSNCDFVLALENTSYPNYLTEKLWDGIMLDRVTLYLGDLNIEKHIPVDCFVDLRPYYDLKTKKFNFVGLGERLNEMTQDEYDAIIVNAREFRKTIVGKHSYYNELLTNKILNFIKTC